MTYSTKDDFVKLNSDAWQEHFKICKGKECDFIFCDLLHRYAEEIWQNLVKQGLG